MDNVQEGLAVRVTALGMEYPGANGSGLIGERVAVIGCKNCPCSLPVLFADGVAVFFECGFYGSNFCGDS